MWKCENWLGNRSNQFSHFHISTFPHLSQLLTFVPLKKPDPMESLKDKIDLQRLPRHIAIIMDGNGRWARERGEDRLFGHYHGVESVRDIVEASAELGVGYLTLYAFSTENWDRPEYEVMGLMELLVDTIRKEVPTLNKNNIRLHVIGDVEMLPDYAKKELQEALNLTSTNSGLNLIMALSYSSRWEITEAIKAIEALDVEDTDIESFLRLGGKFYHAYPAMVKERGQEFRAGQIKIVVPGE